MSSVSLYQEYTTKMQKIADVKYASAVLQWDQETYLPSKGSHFRGRQIATLSEIAHQQFTDEKLGAILNELNGQDLNKKEKKNVQLTLEDYARNKKFTSDFVRKMSETTNRSFHAWIQARKENSFAVFQQPLDELIQLKKQEADMLGYEQHPYNALMSEFDKGLTVNIVDKIFTNLKLPLKELLNTIEGKTQVDDTFLRQHFNKDDQWKLGLEILKRMHFDFEAGRQDISEHPFTTNFNNSDVRVTTRVDENDLGNMVWSCIHEGGHALYEQGLPGEEYGLPLGEYCSLSIHESQSRLWENSVGRSRNFWAYNLPLLQTIFPQQFSNISLEQFYKGINKVAPSLIRTEADEITYHFHVMIRYEIEKMLIEGSISTKDIPAYWNEHYQKYLGITVPDDKRGCLQDVHWSHGSFGYFATYSLGTMYGAQMYAAIEKERINTGNEIAAGNNQHVLDWLRKNIHQYGKLYTSEELCTRATGEPLNPQYFIEYATRKIADIYN
ncbi:MAG: carboxypeptidase M32 [Sphingobacteriales bacterium]|nr:carboxypeptidase M32 [Sphingobacteriales bacterium]